MLVNCRIGLLSDIHANLHALQAVIHHARMLEAGELWNAGDTVGYGAYPNEVLDTIKAERILSIQGNYDTKVLKVPKKQDSWINSKNPKKWQALIWAYQHLDKRNRKFLSNLPESISLERQGWKIILLHGSPASPEEPLEPDCPLDRLQTLAEIVKETVIVCGHSHHGFVRKVGHKYFINPGSVGRQDDGDPRASYALLILTEDQLQVSIHRVQYDFHAAALGIQQNNLPDEFAQIILSGRGFQNL